MVVWSFVINQPPVVGRKTARLLCSLDLSPKIINICRLLSLLNSVPAERLFHILSPLFPAGKPKTGET